MNWLLPQPAEGGLGHFSARFFPPKSFGFWRKLKLISIVSAE
jgi:hypothetical protein